MRPDPISFCALAVLTACCIRPGPRVGDGADYYLTLISIAENGTVWATPRTVAIYNAYAVKRGCEQGFLKLSEMGDHNHLPTSGPGRIELNHFWFYSLLASPFYWPLKWVGADVGLSFNLLHVALLFWAAWAAHRQLGRRAARCLVLLVAFSPALWFINKAHTEFFTVITTTVAMVYFLSGRYVWCAVWFAAASTQNPPFGILAVCALGFAFAERKWALLAEHKLALAAAAGLVLIHPGYYLLQHGTLTPSLLTGHTRMENSLLPIQQLGALWIDPDVGMFPNWPWGLLILAVSGWLCWKGSLPVRWRVVALASAAVLVLGWCTTRAGNVNHGGTVNVSRYGLWFLCLFFPLLCGIVDRLAAQRRAVFWTVAAAALAPGLYTLAQYHPGRPEVCDRPTPLSLLVYRHLPGLYDPMPEVFSERYGNREDFQVGAVSHPSGSKVLVWDDFLEHFAAGEAVSVPGCAELDPAAVCEAAGRRLARRPGRYYVYLNGLEAELKQGANRL